MGKSDYSHPLVFLLTAPRRFLCSSVDSFIYGVCFVIVCSSSRLLMVHREGYLRDFSISRVFLLIFLLLRSQRSTDNYLNSRHDALPSFMFEAVLHPKTKTLMISPYIGTVILVD